MGVTVVVIGLPNHVTINTIAQCFDALFDADEIGAFYLCDFRNAKYKWHKWQIALHFNSGYDAMIAQSILDGYNFLVDTAAYLLHARIRNDPNMLNNRLLNMVQDKMLRRSSRFYEQKSKLSFVSQFCTEKSFQQYSNEVPNYYYYLHSDMFIQNYTQHYLQSYKKYRYSNRRSKASKLPNLPTILYDDRLNSSKYISIQNKNSSEIHTPLNISNKEEEVMPVISKEDSGITGGETHEASEAALIEDITDQKLDPVSQLKSVETPSPPNSHDEIDNHSFLDNEDKIWDAIDEVLHDIRTDIMFSEDDVSEKKCDSTNSKY